MSEEYRVTDEATVQRLDRAFARIRKGRGTDLDAVASVLNWARDAETRAAIARRDRDRWRALAEELGHRLRWHVTDSGHVYPERELSEAALRKLAAARKEGK